MKFSSLALSALALRTAEAYLVSPDGTAAPGASEDCSAWVQDSYLLTCAIIEKYYGMTEAQFIAWNPSVALLGDCTMVEGLYYCVEVNYQVLTNVTTSVPTSTQTTSTKATSTTSTSTSTAVITPSPVQTGIAANCDKFLLVTSGNSCSNISTTEGITLDDFYAWNPAVGNTCANLLAGDYVCVGVSGTPTSTVSSPTASQTIDVPTPQPTQPGMTANCNNFAIVDSSSETCSDIASAAGITLTEFYAWNPAVGNTCSNLLVNYWVCVGVASSAATTSITTSATSSSKTTSTTSPAKTTTTTSSTITTSATSSPKTTTTTSSIKTTTTTSSVKTTTTTLTTTSTTFSTKTTTTSTKTTTTSTNKITTPTPIQTGMVSDCDDFYLVHSGDTCANIASVEGISLTNFYAWNPAVGSSCTGLQASVYVCIGLQGSAPTQTITTLKPTSTTKGNGIATPTPVQTGMVSDCDDFYLVHSGDTCANIASVEGISLTNFYAWNPAVGSSCAGLQAGVYVCIGLQGSAPTQTITTLKPTSTTKGNGITTPTPVQTGMVSDCDAFYLVHSGDTCSNIASVEGITLANFYAWNPAVGSSCAGLQASVYVCIGLQGSAPTRTVTTLKPTTTTGNGVTTPTPHQVSSASY
ncbi:hypothetical protein F4859DRAFT_65195 [Xylaria cf. heliscus]|nr:hypothetical protein F4859DRAFT_65195 [Xylaria cf. heliscus]